MFDIALTVLALAEFDQGSTLLCLNPTQSNTGSLIVILVVVSSSSLAT